MNLPNKLTVVRMILVPVYLVFALCDSIPHNWLAAFVIFVVASFTDMLDGKIARRDGLVTNFGKFMDPLADKLLVSAALIAFIPFGFAGVIPNIIVIFREFAVSGIRMVAASGNGTVIAANMWGKVKTALQMIVISVTLFMLEIAEVIGSQTLYGAVKVGSFWAIWVLAIYTFISGVVYVWQNRALINPKD